MEYTVNMISKISGVSARTLRYYDEIGLLKPMRVAASGYRLYGQRELDTLQQILFYRELDFSLDGIKCILLATDFDREQAFHRHLAQLSEKRERIDILIDNITKSISAMKGDITMSNNEKFEGFKQTLVDENEQKYGNEIRSKYGDAVADASNANFKGLTQAQYNEGERLRIAYEEKLKAAFMADDPASELAQQACDLHRQWLLVFYPKYNKEYHKGLAEMYVADERFKANYEKLAPGCAAFFHDAINIYCD
ncbi:MAG: MerR family transcriptional regulator [Defluviitaleaceae bacterium]|nr:MerR family transcriptional regulator [Defluviitaleaceae bacterium]